MTPASPTRARLLSSGFLASFDPGLLHPAIAVFSQGCLRYAGRVAVPGRLKDLERGERVRQIAKLAVAAILQHTGGVLPLALVGEWPKTLPSVSKGSKNSPDQLFPLAAMTTAVAALLDVEAITPIPFEWIGTIPKDDSQPNGWASPRGQLIWRRLSEAERAVVAVERNGFVSHDAVDAAGIGMWSLGRLEKVYVGSTPARSAP